MVELELAERVRYGVFHSSAVLVNGNEFDKESGASGVKLWKIP